MNSNQLLSARSLLFGVMVWLVPFAMGFFTFPVKSKWPLVFKTIMSVVLVFTTAVLSRMYFGHLTAVSPTYGVLLGIVWAAICVAIDVPIFIFAFKMSASSYFLEIGLAYLAVPAITWSSVSLIGVIQNGP